MVCPRILIVYHSCTGTTRAVASALRAELRCEMESIVELGPPRGLARSFAATVLNRRAKIAPLHADLDAYDLVIVGAPLLNTSMSPAVSAFLERYGSRLRAVAFFGTHVGVGSARALRRMSEVCGVQPLLTLDVRMQEVRDHAIGAKIRSFAETLQSLLAEAEPPMEDGEPLVEDAVA